MKFLVKMWAIYLRTKRCEDIDDDEAPKAKCDRVQITGGVLLLILLADCFSALRNNKNAHLQALYLNCLVKRCELDISKQHILGCINGIEALEVKFEKFRRQQGLCKDTNCHVMSYLILYLLVSPLVARKTCACGSGFGVRAAAQTLGRECVCVGWEWRGSTFRGVELAGRSSTF